MIPYMGHIFFYLILCDPELPLKWAGNPCTAKDRQSMHAHMGNSKEFPCPDPKHMDRNLLPLPFRTVGATRRLQ